MDRWKAEMGRGREKRKIRREKIRRERVRGQKIQMREKVGKSRNTVFFQWFVAPEGRKVGSLKRRCAEPFGQMSDEKVHAVVARSTFRSQNVQSTPFSDHFWKLRCRKSARRCGSKHISKSKCAKHTILGPLLEVCDVEKVHAVVARSNISKSKCTKHTSSGPLLDIQISFRVAGARDCAPCQKWAKREGFVASPKRMAGMGHLKRICKDAFSVAGAVQKTCSSEMFGGQGRWFPERGCILEHQICRCAKMILRDRCITSYDLASLFHGRRSTLDTWNGQIAKRFGTRPSALRFWRC